MNEDDGDLSEYPFDGFPEKGSDWKAVQTARYAAIAQFRNIIQDCDSVDVHNSTIRSRCKSYAVNGLKLLAAEI